ncbi:hypothetical protein BGZ54_000339 [Gamsiella multidivaricata]|nr:hypothetical protein BGZ54_000339 [Gamsiella multidivaricata]
MCFSVASVIINESAFLDKSNPTRYAFDLVFSTSQVLSPECRNVIKEPPKAIKESPKASEESPRVNESEKSLKELSPEKYQDLLALLCDFRTVDVAFVFTIYECNARVALWAHRVMLDRHPRFRELFKSHQDSVSADGPLMVLVEGIALTTFCALLKYLYTDDLGLTIDPEQFLVCSMGDLEEVHSSGDKHVASAVLTKTLRELNASQFHASWEVKDKVTWADLFLAADRFEIPKLRQQCLKNLLGSVEKSNAMEILFGVGQHFKAEIRDPVMKYISEHLDDVFSIQTEDPFKRFSGYAGYHEMMLELLRVSRSK